MNTTRWPVIKISKLLNFNIYQHFYFHYQPCYMFELRISVLLGKAVLLSFLIITYIRMFPVYFFGRAIFMINKLNNLLSRFEHEQMVFFSVFLKVLCLSQHNLNYDCNSITENSQKDKTSYKVLGLHNYFQIIDLFSLT